MNAKHALWAAALLAAVVALAACGPLGWGPVEKTVYVGPYQVECVGVTPQKCLLVREKPDEEWRFSYGTIAGLEYEPGYQYTLRVRQETVDNPPADASSLLWVLVDLVEKTRALEGTDWILRSYAGSQGETFDVLPSSQVTARFLAGQVGGNAGCNSYFGSYQTDGETLTVEGIGSTMMMCTPEELMAQEQAYLAALGNAASYTINGDELQIAGAGGQTLLTYGVLQPAPLTGTPWQLTGYNNGKGGFASVLAGSEITALFGADGSLSGSAGCNNYTSTYEVNGSAITLGPAATTRKMCAEPEGVMDQETAYLAALQSATAFEIRGSTLTLTDASGTRMAEYNAGTAGEADTGSGEEAASLSPESLANMTYQNEFAASGTVTLEDGKYSEPIAPESATELKVELTEWSAWGEMNGETAAAVVLVSDPGGSGTFYDLALVIDDQGTPVNVATMLLGDRVEIQSLAIQENQIVVEMITHGPDDPMCCPTQQVVQTYAWEGDALVQTSNQVVGTVPDAGDTLVGPVWQWTQFTDPLQQFTIDDPSRYTVQFLPDGQVQIQADCNRAGGSYTTEGSSLTIELGPTTLAACPPDSRADQFLQSLAAVRIYSFQEGQLLLDLFADGGTMVFSAGE